VRKYTKKEAREALGAKNDLALARKLGVTSQAIYYYRSDDDVLSENLCWRVSMLEKMGEAFG